MILARFGCGRLRPRSPNGTLPRAVLVASSCAPRSSLQQILSLSGVAPLSRRGFHSIFLPNLGPGPKCDRKGQKCDRKARCVPTGLDVEMDFLAARLAVYSKRTGGPAGVTLFAWLPSKSPCTVSSPQQVCLGRPVRVERGWLLWDAGGRRRKRRWPLALARHPPSPSERPNPAVVATRKSHRPNFGCENR